MGFTHGQALLPKPQPPKKNGNVIAGRPRDGGSLSPPPTHPRSPVTRSHCSTRQLPSSSRCGLDERRVCRDFGGTRVARGSGPVTRSLRALYCTYCTVMYRNVFTVLVYTYGAGTHCRINSSSRLTREGGGLAARRRLAVRSVGGRDPTAALAGTRHALQWRHRHRHAPGPAPRGGGGGQGGGKG